MDIRLTLSVGSLVICWYEQKTMCMTIRSKFFPETAKTKRAHDKSFEAYLKIGLTLFTNTRSRQ
jgi:hypothetical protein